jgi:hypothetical protein
MFLWYMTYISIRRGLNVVQNRAFAMRFVLQDASLRGVASPVFPFPDLAGRFAVALATTGAMGERHAL